LRDVTQKEKKGGLAHCSLRDVTRDFERGERQGAPAQAGSAAEDVNVAADQGRRSVQGVGDVGATLLRESERERERANVRAVSLSHSLFRSLSLSLSLALSQP